MSGLLVGSLCSQRNAYKCWKRMMLAQKAAMDILVGCPNCNFNSRLIFWAQAMTHLDESSRRIFRRQDTEYVAATQLKVGRMLLSI